MALTRLMTEGGIELAQVLADALCSRLAWVLSSLTSMTRNLRMDIAEERVFRLAHSTYNALAEWMRIGADKRVLRPKRQRSD